MNTTSVAQVNIHAVSPRVPSGLVALALVLTTGAKGAATVDVRGVVVGSVVGTDGASRTSGEVTAVAGLGAALCALAWPVKKKAHDNTAALNKLLIPTTRNS
ncbi:MAG: hypothetical protein ABL985_20255 [Casimicrobium sp.]